MATFAEQLTAARKAAGMTQEELSEVVHVARNTISNWERGQRQPDLDMLRLLGQVLHTDFLNDSAAQADTIAIKTEADDENAQADSASPPPKKKIGWIVLAILALIAGVILLLQGIGDKDKPVTDEAGQAAVEPIQEPAAQDGAADYQPAARLEDEAGQLTMAFFQEPAQRVDGLPYLSFRSDTTVTAMDGNDVWMYFLHFYEINGYAFKINRAVLYYFAMGQTMVDAYSSDWLESKGLSSLIEANTEWTINGGFPLQPYLGVGIILYGEDENGVEMEFHGYVEYDVP